jgi:hypothetical protein
MLECIVALPVVSDNSPISVCSNIFEIALSKHQCVPSEAVEDDFKYVLMGKLRDCARVEAVGVGKVTADIEMEYLDI